MSIRSATESLLSTLFGTSQTTRAKDLGKRLEGKNRALSYGEWLRQFDAEESDALKAARTKREKGSPVYGAAAEKLIDRGLSGTGYANYLREKNEEAYRAAARGIRKQSDPDERGNRDGYLAYLQKWETSQDELMQKTLSGLAESKTSGIDDAYADALAAGLSDERAKIVSRVAPSVARYGMRRLREGSSGVLAVSLSAGLSGEEAELLARACGVSLADAKKLRGTVESSLSGGSAGESGRWE